MTRQKIAIYLQNVMKYLEFLIKYLGFWYKQIYESSYIYNEYKNQVYNKIYIGK